MAAFKDISVKDCLIKFIKNYYQYRFGIRIATFLNLIGFVCVTVSLTDLAWSRSDSTEVALWEHCFINDTFTCCESYDDFVGYYPGWLTVTMVFLWIGLVSAVATVVVFVLIMCINVDFLRNYPKIKKKLHAAFCSFTGIILFVAVVVFGSSHDSETWTTENRVTSSFYVPITACVLFSFSGGILIFGYLDAQDDALRPYWTKTEIDMEKQKSRATLIEASKTEYDAIKEIIENTWRSDLVGKGHDAHGLKALQYNKIQVKKIERNENNKLFKKYAYSKETLTNRINMLGLKFQKIQDTQPSNRQVDIGPIKTKYVKENVFHYMDEDINEFYLFHGAEVRVIDDIVADGININIGRSGMMGKAFYTAESRTKSDQYADKDPNRDKSSDKKMFLMRMILGDMHIIKHAKPLVDPPCKICLDDKCNDTSHHQTIGWKFDSVIYASSKKLFREFIIYDTALCYPEYVITYRRI